MKFQFWSIGKVHDTYVQEGIEDFTKRINHYYDAEWTIIPPLRNAASLAGIELKKQEAKLVLSKLKKDDFLVLLDEAGRQLSSEELAQFISNKASANARLVIFLIGGAFGVSDEVKRRADFTWSLSKLVFPHMLSRLILAEQIYRACSILSNEKYHHA